MLLACNPNSDIISGFLLQRGVMACAAILAARAIPLYDTMIDIDLRRNPNSGSMALDATQVRRAQTY